MSKYDSMSFKELVQETINHSCNDLLLPPDDWLDMLRKAVIREASVGVVQSWKDGDGCRSFQMKPCGPDNCKECEALVEGDYDIIPKLQEIS